MEQKDILLSVGFDRKYGGYEFGVRADIVELSFEEMQKFRAMIIAAIGTMEDMWRREKDKENPAQTNEKQTL